MSWLSPQKVRRITAVGSRKMAVYDDLATDERIRVYDKAAVPTGGGRRPAIAGRLPLGRHGRPVRTVR